VLCLSASCRIAYLGYSTLNMVSNVGIGTIGVATLLVGLPASCDISSRSFSWPGLMFWVGVATRSHDALRQFSSVVFCRFPRFMFAKMLYCFGVASIRVGTLGVAFLVSCLVLSLGSWILSRLRDNRRCDARRRFVSVLSCVFPRLMYALYGIFCWRLDARCRFVSIVSHGV
jgi:hypothetical protein